MPMGMIDRTHLIDYSVHEPCQTTWHAFHLVQSRGIFHEWYLNSVFEGSLSVKNLSNKFVFCMYMLMQLKGSLTTGNEFKNSKHVSIIDGF